MPGWHLLTAADDPLRSMNTKPWWQSKTILGAIAGGVPTAVVILKYFGVDITDLSGSLSTGLLGLLGLIGTIVAIVGRFKAWKTPVITS